MRFKIRDRKFYENFEQQALARYAVMSRNANQSRLHREREHAYRTAFQRDRDRIIHSRAFRRLKHKQQVFLISEGDHYRTRLTHTLEVSQLSRTMARALGLNETLVEAIALGHDLGHTPFGHIGEIIINEIMSGRDNLDGILTNSNMGGFKHNYQSLRVLDHIETKYLFDGLNLTSFVREGILKHTRLLRDNYHYPDFSFEGLNFDLDHATTLEGQVVAICDEIAQRTHDLEDGIRAKLVEIESVRNVNIIKIVEKKLNLAKLYAKDIYRFRNQLIHGLINFLMDDVINTTLQEIDNFYKNTNRISFFDREIIHFSEQVEPLQLDLNKFIYEKIIYKCAGNDINNTNKNTIRMLFKKFITSPLKLPEYIVARIGKEIKIEKKYWTQKTVINNPSFIRIIADHIAGMTDSYAGLYLEKMENENKT